MGGDSGGLVGSGEVLTRWLAAKRGSAAAVAAACGTNASAVANWKTRGVPPGKMATVDEALDAGGVFEQISWASTTPAAMAARTHWDFNLKAGHVGSFWLWVRPAEPGPMGIVGRCGVLRATYTANLSTDGVFLTAPFGVANPPTRVVLDRPGWVDIGTGRPPGFLNVERVALVSHVGIDTVINADTGEEEFTPYVRLWTQHVAARTATRFSRLPEILRVPAERLRAALTWSERKEASTTTYVAQPAGSTAPAGMAVLRETRVGRGLKQPDLVERLKLLLITYPTTGAEASSLLHSVDTKRVWRAENEQDKAENAALLLSLIDVALDVRGDGGPYERVPVTLDQRGAGEIHFDPWWSGDYWVTPSEPTTLTLVHGWYAKSVVFAVPGAAVWTRVVNNSDPVKVRTDPPVASVRHGYGRPPHATDVNDTWKPSSREALAATMAWGEQITPRTFSLDPRQFSWLAFRERYTSGSRRGQ